MVAGTSVTGNKMFGSYSAGHAAKRRRRDRWPGTRTVQRNRRPVSQDGRRPAAGGCRPQCRVLGRAGRGAVARAAGGSPPRPHRSRRMAPPITGSLIPHPPTQRGPHGVPAVRWRRQACWSQRHLSLVVPQPPSLHPSSARQYATVKFNDRGARRASRRGRARCAIC